MTENVENTFKRRINPVLIGTRVVLHAFKLITNEGITIDVIEVHKKQTFFVPAQNLRVVENFFN